MVYRASFKIKCLKPEIAKYIHDNNITYDEYYVMFLDD